MTVQGPMEKCTFLPSNTFFLHAMWKNKPYHHVNSNVGESWREQSWLMKFLYSLAAPAAAVCYIGSLLVVPETRGSEMNFFPSSYVMCAEIVCYTWIYTAGKSVEKVHKTEWERRGQWQLPIMGEWNGWRWCCAPGRTHISHRGWSVVGSNICRGE